MEFNRTEIRDVVTGIFLDVARDGLGVESGTEELTGLLDDAEQVPVLPIKINDRDVKVLVCNVVAGGISAVDAADRFMLLLDHVVQYPVKMDIPRLINKEG